MARRKVGKQEVLALGLNEGNPEDAALLELWKASGMTKTEFLRASIEALSSGAAPVPAQAQPAPGAAPGLMELVAELLKLKERAARDSDKVAELERRLRELESRPATVVAQTVITESETVGAVKDEKTGETAYVPLPPKDAGREVTPEEASRWAKRTHKPGIRLEQ